MSAFWFVGVTGFFIQLLITPLTLWWRIHLADEVFLGPMESCNLFRYVPIILIVLSCLVLSCLVLSLVIAKFNFSAKRSLFT